MNCIYCKAYVSDEEMRARYDELCKQGIIPKMVCMCKDCRDGVKEPPMIVRRIN